MVNNCICCGGEVKAVGGGFKCIFCGTLYASEEELIPKKISKPISKAKPAEPKKESLKSNEKTVELDSKSAKTQTEGADVCSQQTETTTEQKSHHGVDVFDMNINGVLEITWNDERYKHSGSGFLISADGYAITNTHVVTHSNGMPCGRVNVRICDEDTTADIVKLGDNRHGEGNGVDLALVKLARVPSKATVVKFEDFDNVRNGERVFVIGNSLGYGTCITSGIVSDRLRNVNGKMLLMTDCAINGGNSGGPVFNENGFVIGTVVSGITDAEGMNFAIPSDTVKKFIESPASSVTKFSVQKTVETDNDGEITTLEELTARLGVEDLSCLNKDELDKFMELLPLMSRELLISTVSESKQIMKAIIEASKSTLEEALASDGEGEYSKNDLEALKFFFDTIQNEDMSSEEMMSAITDFGNINAISEKMSPEQMSCVASATEENDISVEKYSGIVAALFVPVAAPLIVDFVRWAAGKIFKKD